MSPLDYILPFLLALGILIVVHEFGHYLVARLCGVRVLRFSLGFGKPLLVRRLGADQTEWVLSAFPLGGYVKMLDEREAPVAGIGRQAFLALLIDHVKMSALVAEAEIADMEDFKAKRDLGANRVEHAVEGLLGDREIGDAHRHHALLAPHEKRQRRHRRGDFQRAEIE